MADILKYVSLANLQAYDAKIKNYTDSADAALKANLEGQVEVVAGALDSEIARAKAAETLAEVKAAMKINYFEDANLIEEQAKKYGQN